MSGRREPAVTRRHWLAAAAASAAAGVGAGCTRTPTLTAAGCDSLRGQTIRWLVPYSVGGSYDVYSRLLESSLEKELGGEILIANEPGAGGLVGASKLRDAAPDGRTLGILNAPGLLSGSMSGQAGVPNPAQDFTVLGRIGRSWSVLVTGSRSPLRTVEDLVARQRVKPLLFSITGAASNTLLSASGTASLLGLRTDFISGYAGAREEMLAVMRGEVDLLSANYETLQPALEAGDLRALLLVAEKPVSSHPAMAGCALLAGPDGWAARRAEPAGRSRAQAIEDAQALVEVAGAGVIVAAPRRLPVELTSCLRAKFMAAVANPAFVQAVRTAGRSLDAADGESAQQTLAAAAQQMKRFAPLVRDAIARIRK